MGDVIQWVVDPYTSRHYPLNLGLGACPTILFTPRPRQGWGFQISLPGVALSDEERWHSTLEDAKVAAVRIVVGMHAPRIRAEMARLAEVEAWLAEVPK